MFLDLETSLFLSTSVFAYSEKYLSRKDPNVSANIFTDSPVTAESSDMTSKIVLILS